MTPREYLEQVVRPNREHFSKDYASMRHAHNAVHSVDALAAHIFAAGGGKAAGLGDTDTHYREVLARTKEPFRLLRDVAKVAKHVQLDRGKPDVTTAAQMSTRSLGSGEARWEEDRWGSPPQAIVNTDAGEHRVLETVVEQPLAVSFVKL